VKNLQASAAYSHVYASTSTQLHTLALQHELSFRAAAESELVVSPDQLQVENTVFPAFRKSLDNVLLCDNPKPFQDGNFFLMFLSPYLMSNCLCHPPG